MLPDLCIVLSQLLGQCAGADVALRANLQRYSAVHEQVHESGIERSGDAVSYSFDTKYFDGLADFLRSSHLSRVHQEMQAKVCGFVINGPKLLRRNAELVSANAECNDRVRRTPLRCFDDLQGCLGAKLPRGIEDPVQAKPLLFKRLRSPQNSLEILFRLLPSKQHHADGKRDLGVHHALSQQVLAQVPRNEPVIVRLSQK